MAAVFGISSFRRIAPQILRSFNGAKSPNIVISRNVLTAPSGAVFPAPKKVQFSLLKIILVLTPGVYVGAAIAKHGATILEENEIFVPQDDDEED